MDSAALLIAASILLTSVGLVSWAWFVMARIEGDLRAFSKFEAMHFDIGPQARKTFEGAGWPNVG